MTPISHAAKDPLNPGQAAPREDTSSSALPQEMPLPVPIADHQLIRCIGRGSYGQVWLARNMMGVYRAVKIVYRNWFESQRPFERELSGIRRFEPISRLHEGFVDVLQVGINEERGYFYYVMELGDDSVSGQAIDPERYVPKTLACEISARRTLSLQECLQLGLAMSHALAELHQHGLVHRDIKPSNIIFVNGTLKLADIGLVAGVNEARSYVGTEGFIPPEGPGTSQADIYSLGKVLYEASTGKDRQDFPELPTHWGTASEHDGLLELNEVVLQACKQEPSKRYSSAWDMNADLLVVLNGKSVKRLRLLERRMANLKRIGGVAALALAAAGLLLYQVYREWSSAQEARQRRVSSNIAYGNRSMESGDLLAALPYFAEALQLDQGKPDRERTHRLRFGATFAQCPRLVQMWFSSNEVAHGEFSPDGRRVLVAEHFYGKAEIHDLQTGERYLNRFGPDQGLASAVYSPDGRLIVTASENHIVSIWDATDLTELRRLLHPDRVFDARFSPDGSRIVTSCLDGLARVWDVQTGTPSLALTGHMGAVAFATFSHDGSLIATASHDGTARIWNATNGQSTGMVLGHTRWVTCAAFSPDDHLLLTASSEHQASVWDLSTGKERLPELEHNDAVRSVEFSPDGRFILTASLDGTARLWRTDDLQPLGSNPILRHSERVTHAAFSPDGRLILTTCIDGSVRVWDLAGGMMPPTDVRSLFSPDASRYVTFSNDCLQVFEATSGNAVSPLFNPQIPLARTDLSYDGRFILTISQLPGSRETNSLLQVWSVGGGQAVGPGVLISNYPSGAVLSEDGKKVAVWAGIGTQMFEAATGKALSPLLLHKGVVNFARFNPRGDRLVTVNETNVVVWDSVSGRLAYPALTLPVPVGYVDFSRDGRNLVTCCSDPGLTKCFARIWRLSDGRSVGAPLNHGDGVLFAVFSRDGARIVTASEDDSARVWETLHGNEIGLPLKHRDQVWAAAFSSDARWVATASADKTARVWDAERDEPLTPPLRHPATLVDVKFLPGDRRIVTSDRDGRSWIWPLRIDNRPPDDIRLLAQFLSGGELTAGPSSPRNKHDSIDQVWQQLRKKYPADFSTSANEVLAWHELQAQECERKEQWFAAVSHWEHLVLLRPDDPLLVRRLALSKKRLATGK